jgi:hypothetical protein
MHLYRSLIFNVDSKSLPFPSVTIHMWGPRCFMASRPAHASSHHVNLSMQTLRRVAAPYVIHLESFLLGCLNLSLSA